MVRGCPPVTGLLRVRRRHVGPLPGRLRVPVAGLVEVGAVLAVGRVLEVQHEAEVHPAVARDHRRRRRGEARVGHEELLHPGQPGLDDADCREEVGEHPRQVRARLADESLELGGRRRGGVHQPPQVRVVGLQLGGEQVQAPAEGEDCGPSSLWVVSTVRPSRRSAVVCGTG